MPSPGSNFSRYVIPNDLNPTGTCCICVPVPDDLEYKAQFLGALWRMSLQTHYERDDAHSGRTVAAVWRQVYLEVQNCMTCCNEQNVVNNFNQFTLVQNSIKLLQQNSYNRYIDANLDVQIAFIGVPDNYDTDPGDTGAEVNQRNLALCIACRGWVDEACNQGMSWIEGAVPDAFTALGTVLATGFITMPVAIGVGLSASFAVTEVHSELVNEAYRDYLACGMYEALKGSSATSKASFDACFDNLPSRPPPPQNVFQDAARDIIEKWLRAVVNDLENWLSFVSTLDGAMSVAATLEPGDCGCLSWTHVFLDGAGQEGLVAIPLGPLACVATYNALDDRFDSCCMGEPEIAHGSLVKRVFTSTLITSITLEVETKVTRTTTTDKFSIRRSDDSIIAEGDVPDGIASKTLNSGPIAETLDEIRFRAVAASDACADDAYARIVKIIISGEGDNPFL